MEYLLFALLIAATIITISKVANDSPNKKPPWSDTQSYNQAHYNSSKRYENTASNKTMNDKAGQNDGGYQAKYLLTKNEWYEHKKLRKYAEERGLIVCPKVRLLDIVEPIRGNGYMSRLGRIQSKHVDFVICDQNMHIKGVLELDDNSHNQPDREKRDVFVNTLLQRVGYTVIRTKCVTETTLDVIARKPETPPTNNQTVQE